MASGDRLALFLPYSNEPPAANYATFDTRNQHPVMDLAIDEICIFTDEMPMWYAGGGVTSYAHYTMTSAETNDVKLEISFERIGEVLDVDADSFAAAQDTGDITVGGTSGIPDIITVTHTDGAQMDSVAIGELYRVKVKRVAVAGTDAAGDLELHAVEIRET